MKSFALMFFIGGVLGLGLALATFGEQMALSTIIIIAVVVSAVAAAFVIVKHRRKKRRLP